MSITAGELAEVFHAGWSAIPHSRGLAEPVEAVTMALQAMERKAREFQRLADRDRDIASAEYSEKIQKQFAPPGMVDL